MLISRHPPFIVYSGYSFWGSIFFIVSGSFSIAAERKPICQQSSLETNIISTILAGIGIITASSNLSITAMGIYHQEKYDSAENAFLLSVLLILIILEFCIAIALTNFKCKMSCVNFSESEGYLPSNSNEPEIALHERVYEHLTSGSLDYDQLNFQK
ncbi:membrane-spanning 4-domains subfamily A member 8-like [Ornithorhynchus anatinus]|uniref:membrane-spanning 4-domains subfamily A member 8-like n=1 Tax=Ornithorhynchus anatinus TaxID=9258 RepID=UPI0019D41631|nr:membrane-spanning 4-domains subfamily A member 8-like [Ornithorhynchus anatinus]